MKFFNLHQHTTYSFLDGYGQPHQYVERLNALEQGGMALTEHGNIYSHIPFTKPFKEAGKHLVYGIEFYIVDKLEPKARGYYHITALAKTNEGYQNLLKLVNLSFTEGQFYYKPRVSYAQLMANSKGLIILTGCCCDGYLVKNKEKDQKKAFETWCKNFKKVEWYIELQPFKDEQAKWDKLTDLAIRYGVPAVVTADAHYPGPEHKAVQDFQLAINTNKKFGDPDRLKLEYPLYVPSGDEMHLRCLDMGGPYKQEWVTQTEAIGLSCQVQLPTTSMVKLSTSIESLRRRCVKRLKELGLDKPEYKARLKYELGLIREKDFADYFALVSDMCIWAKKRMLVGAGRGSSAGSLVCYLLRITEVDPLVHGLLFERFIDINRRDLPDIDLDFPSSQREEVIQYLRDRYGEENTSQLITFSTFRPRAILQDGGRSLGIPPWETREAASQIVERSGGDARAEFCLADSIEQFDKLKAIFTKYPDLKNAIPLEGQVRQSGTHAAAVVISSAPLREVGAINRDGAFGMDKKHIEEYGLLKIDVLGIETLSIIGDVCREVGFDVDALYTLPLDDERVYKEVFQAMKLVGIFQFEGLALQQTCKYISPERFEQLVHITALSRPGPLNSGGTSTYIERHNGTPYTITKGLEPYTQDTLGVIIYQEQVMNVVKELGHFGWDSVGAVRKAMSKSLGEEFFNKYKEGFIKGAAQEGLTEGEAVTIWKQIMTHGSWSFNKSHAVSYALLSYWTAYCKTYWPAQFYARILKGEGEEEKIKTVLREWGGPFLPVDLNLSKEDWTVSPDGKVLVGGFTSIKGIGAKGAEKIIKGQPYEGMDDFKSRVAAGVAKKVEGAITEGCPWANLSSLKEQVASKLETLELSVPLVHLREVLASPYQAAHNTLGRVLAVQLRDRNEASKVAERGGKLAEGDTEYFIIRAGDEEAVAVIYFNPSVTKEHKQTLLGLKDKVCIFRVNKAGEGDLLVGRKFKELT